jgi:hypothetical protein
MLLLDVIDLAYVLDMLRRNICGTRPAARDNGAHVTNPSCEYIRYVIGTAI